MFIKTNKKLQLQHQILIQTTTSFIYDNHQMLMPNLLDHVRKVEKLCENLFVELRVFEINIRLK